MGSSRVNFTPKPTSTQIIHLEVLLITPLQSKRLQLHETHCYHALSEDQTSSEAFGEKGSGPRTLPQATQKPHGDGSDNRSVGSPRSDGHVFVAAGERCSAQIRWPRVQTPCPTALPADCPVDEAHGKYPGHPGSATLPAGTGAIPQLPAKQSVTAAFKAHHFPLLLAQQHAQTPCKNTRGAGKKGTNPLGQREAGCWVPFFFF